MHKFSNLDRFIGDGMFSLIRALAKAPGDFYQMVICHLPGEVGYSLRYRYWKKRLRYLGESVRFETGLHFQNPGFIEINDNCWIDRHVLILAGLDTSSREKIVLKNKSYPGEPGVVHIGKNVHIGISCIISGISAGVYISDECGISANCKIYAFSHHYRSRKNPKNTNIHFGPLVDHGRQCIIEGPIYIGKNSGIALNSIILPGANIPENCFISVNSVVMPGRINSNSILSGNPAKQIDTRFFEDE